MALPTAYLTNVKNLKGILEAMKTAQAPKRFSQKFLIELGYSSSGDRLLINVLKSLGFLTEDGKPTQRYFDFLDQTQSERVLADGIREAYKDLFAINRDAHKLSQQVVKEKFKTLSEGGYSQGVLGHMARTFTALVKLADFKAKPAVPKPEVEEPEERETPSAEKLKEIVEKREVKLSGLVYNIQIVLPESRDPAVYDALFRSLKEHLF